MSFRRSSHDIRFDENERDGCVLYQRFANFLWYEPFEKFLKLW